MKQALGQVPGAQLKDGEGEGLGEELALVRAGVGGGGGLEEEGVEGGRLTGEEREAAECGYREVLDWLDSEHHQGDQEEYERRYQVLKALWLPLSENTKGTNSSSPIVFIF